MPVHTLRFISPKRVTAVLVALVGFGAVAAVANPTDPMPAQPHSATQLIMVEQTGCGYCARWNTEISDIYPKTPEGAYAPLRRMDLRAQRPSDVTFNSPLVVTPTFVLVKDGVEQARIEGYGGDEMFWAMLTVTLRNNSNFEAQTSE